jgi:hypothetical protein
VAAADKSTVKKALSYAIIRMRFKVLQKYCALPEPKNNMERKAGDETLNLIISPRHGFLSNPTNVPFSEIKYFYDVNGLVFKI